MLRAERLIEMIRGGSQPKDVADPPMWQIEKLRFQENVCRILLLPLGAVLVFMMKYVRGYRIDNLREIRRRFQRIWFNREHAGTPLLICANHLTFIDSALLIWAFAPNRWYFFNYRAFMWNIPAGDFFKKKFIHHAVLYLTKCIFIDRKGSAAHKNAVLNLCRYLLSRGHLVLIFPEGQRSRTATFEVDRLRFGAGKILTSLDRPEVLCAYIRSPKQTSYSNYPPRGSHFQIDLQVISPDVAADASRKRASLSAVREIGTVIKRMEEDFFERNPGSRPAVSE